MTSSLVDYMIELQTVALQLDFKNYGLMPANNVLKRIFDLQRMQNIKHLDIHFIGPSGQLLDTNKPLIKEQPLAMPDWFFKLLSDYLYEEPVVKTVTVAGQQLGEIHISHNLNSEINEIWETSKDMIFPLLLVFLTGCLLIAVMASLIVKPVEKLLHLSGQMSGQAVKRRSAFAGMSGIRKAGSQLDDIGRQLQNYNRQLRELNEQMLTLHEDEQKRLSAELHDEIGQHLTAIRFDTATIATAVDLAEARQAGASIDNINRQLSDIIRSMLQRLRPPSLDTAGLAASLIELAGEWRQRHSQHDLQLTIDGDLAELPDTINLTVYRAVQEALTNIVRHAGDEVRVNVDVLQTHEKIQLTVSDNGRGCDLSSASSGYGLLAMRERVESLAGKFTVSSAPGAGLTVTLSMPL